MLLICAGIAAVLVLAYVFVIHPWYARWGATADEVAMKLPGDELSPQANVVSTRAVSVRAPAAGIYPWLVQIGQGRAGMYSYEWLENLARCDMHNVYQIVPALQQLQPGQEIHMGPEGYPFYRVYAFEPGRYLVLQPGNPATKEPGDAAWTFYLQEEAGGATRLIARQQMRVAPGLGNFIIWRVITEPLSFVMEQKMLRTVRDLAEAHSQPQALAGPPGF